MSDRIADLNGGYSLSCVSMDMSLSNLRGYFPAANWLWLCSVSVCLYPTFETEIV